MTAALTAACLLIASTGAWTVVLALGPHDRPAVTVVAVALSLWTAVVAAIAGMAVSRSRWARRLALGLTVAHAALAVTTPVSVWWWIALAVSAVTALAVAGPWLSGYVRSLPAAAGPPARAVLVPILLVMTPFAVGLAGGDGLAAVVVCGFALLTAFWFIRTLPGALVAVRLVWPVVAGAFAWSLGWPAGAVAVAMGLAVAVVAWDPSVTRAVVPLVKSGSIVAIPPELTPAEVLDAADVDDRGRPR